MSVSSSDLIALGLLALQVGFVLMMIVYLVSGLDDLFFDLLFFLSKTTQCCAGNSRRRLPSLEEMADKPEQPFALMFPAWQEASVIRRALLNTIGNIDYRNFHVFVGTYVNDLETQREVEEVMREHANVTQLIVPHPGPTCKADCLNWIVRGIRDYQAQHGIRFAGVILHDAEDVVDTLSLKLFNCLMPEWDLVQIPIISLARPWWDLVGGHYMDEFAEAHCKDLHVREWFAGIVPGAGVGTGYSMQALDAAAAVASGDCFSTDSLTEDYEFSFRVHQLGLNQTFVRYPIERRMVRRSFMHREPRLVSQRDFITTREFFPHLFWASVRQKTRWVIGITLQGWKKFGWRGNWRVRYLYFRDRKALFTQQFMALGYVVAFGLIGLQISSALFPDRYIFAPPFEDSSWLWDLFYINVALFANRLAHRHLWTCRVYGWSQFPLILPRYLVANVVNYFAVTRATLRYLRHLRTTERIGWDKTAHSFPGEELLAIYRRKLGDILIERGLVTKEQLDRGLAAQAATGRPLGSAIVDLGALDEDVLIEVLCDQLHLSRAPALDPYGISLDLLRRLPEHCAKALSVFPIEENDDGKIVLACAVVPDRSGIQELEAALQRPVEFQLARRAEVALALRHGYARLKTATARAVAFSPAGD
ncbi:MAG TPA: glycosyl transferase family protein, partial [Stellaceae bacterium]|nr:glycosyl transferase family protein [Stellaceae bacterium]